METWHTWPWITWLSTNSQIHQHWTLRYNLGFTIHITQKTTNHSKELKNHRKTIKQSKNHKQFPTNRVLHMLQEVINEEKFDPSLRMSFTVPVKQSISFTTAAVPIGCCGWRLFHNDVYKNLYIIHLICCMTQRRSISYIQGQREVKFINIFLILWDRQAFRAIL
jgi:hypothetical protein